MINYLFSKFSIIILLFVASSSVFASQKNNEFVYINNDNKTIIPENTKVYNLKKENGKVGLFVKVIFDKNDENIIENWEMKKKKDGTIKLVPPQNTRYK